MSDWSLTYTKRCVDFFFKSIQDLKRQSGGQRWNEICEDAVDLFFVKYPKELGEVPFSRQQLWELFFTSIPDEEATIRFLTLCQTPQFSDFLFVVLQAFLDPPAVWWRKHFI